MSCEPKTIGDHAPCPPDENFFRHLCEALGFVQIAVDEQLRVCFWNRQAERQFGATAAAMQGKPFVGVFEPAQREPISTLLTAAVQRGEAGEMEIKHPGPSGERLTLVLIASPIMDDRGRPIGASASMRDISQRKRLSQQLALSRRMNALGNMAAGVVHHFNNLLGGILTSIDSVMNSDSPRELRRTLKLIQQSMGRITRIIQHLEAFAKSEHEQVEWAELNPLLRRFVDTFSPKARAAQMNFVTDIAEVSGQPFEAQRLIPVLESLAQNALDAMEPGGTLTLRMRAQGNEAVITVTDTGRGMPEAVIDRLFEPFFTTKGELAGGTASNIGLGLAAVHGLVAEMGGSIHVRSKLGEGTEMEVRLPLEADAPADGVQLEPPAKA